MELIDFAESNVKYAEYQDEYMTMPAHRSDSNIITSCWKMNWKERIKTLWSGRVYVNLWTAGSPQPQRLSTEFNPKDFE